MDTDSHRFFAAAFLAGFMVWELLGEFVAAHDFGLKLTPN
jgi:hypothetical protein